MQEQDQNGLCDKIKQKMQENRQKNTNMIL